MKNVFRVNNFDLIRLIAALQVALTHSLFHLDLKSKSWFLKNITDVLPGVPVFFFVSGFLISKSYEKNSVLPAYTRNRLLRIYPALIVCTFVSILSVFLTGYLENISNSIYKIIFLIFGQISIFQFYNPDFMRGFGTGVLNGSLWTITVELQFYALVPLLYFVLTKNSQAKKKDNIILLLLISIFMIINIVHSQLRSEYDDYLLYKLWRVSFSPWFYMFLIGIFFQKNFEKIHHVFHNKFFIILLIYLFFV